MPAPADLVHQQTTGTGTGNLTLTSVNGKRNFATVFGSGATTNVFDYFISNTGAAEWERGTGHMSDATTLVRDTAIESSNANALVSFSAGLMDVTNDIPAGAQIINPLTTRGDIIVQGSAGIARLGIGTAGQVIKSNGTDVLYGDLDWRLLTSGVIANSATSLNIVLTSYTAYRNLRIILTNCVFNTNATPPIMRFSTNGGSTYDNTNYSDCIWTSKENLTPDKVGANALAQIYLTSANFPPDNGSGLGWSSFITLADQTNNAVKTHVWIDSVYSSANSPCTSVGGGMHDVVQDTDAIQFLSGGAANFATSNPGKFAVYGMR